MLVINGSQGEGGGQILRSSVGLSLITGTPVRIENIRGRRSKPGLLRQHLTAVNAAVEISGGHARGAQLRSGELEFTPGPVRPGDYSFSIGSAGSTSLVLQTILPALALASAPSTVQVSGGTHNPFSPTFDFLDRTLFPLLEVMGPRVESALHRPGYYPAGGGRAEFRISPASQLRPLSLLERGPVVRRAITATVANVATDIGHREVVCTAEALGWEPALGSVVTVDNSLGPGNVLTVEVASESVTEVITGFGKKGVAAEDLARQVAAETQRYLDANVPVGEHLADQLLLWLALAGKGEFRTLALTAHTKTHCDVIEAFLGVTVACEQLDDGSVLVRVS